MKKILLFAAVAASVLSLAGCKKDGKSVDTPVVESQAVRLTVGIQGSKTKVTGVTSNSTASEAKVNSIEVLIFKDNGATLDGYAKVSADAQTPNPNSVTVDCTAGEREIFAVVNAPVALHLELVSKKSDLLSKVAVLANEISNFQMIGSTTANLKQDTAINVDVYRHAARIVLKSIKNSLPNDTQAAAFTIKAVYLSNVAGTVDFGHSASFNIQTWYNKRGYQPSNNLGSFTRDEVAAANGHIAKGASYSEPHYLYAMPNDSTDFMCKDANYEAYVNGLSDEQLGLAAGASAADRAAAISALLAAKTDEAVEASPLPLTWSPRSTRLVILAEIDGVDYVYPIRLPVLQSNKSYEINVLELTRLGNKYSDDGDGPTDGENTGEEDDVQSIQQAFQITVVDWDVVLLDNDEDAQTDGHWVI